MDRLKRLQALQAERASSTAVFNGRKRVEARVLHVHAPVDANKEEEEAMRAKVKEMALKKRLEAESRMPEVSNIPTATIAVAEEESIDESSSEEEAHIMLKPVFVPKNERQLKKDDEEEEEDYDRIKEERHREAHALLAEYVRLESAANKRKEEELEATSGAFDPKSIDDTDDVDEEAEFQAWKLRELLRLKRDRDEREAREREQIELERLRNLTEEEKQEIDREKEAAWAAESKDKSDYRFLQKYYHKGAFYSDLDESITKRDFAQPTGEDHSRKDFLPESMQVKNFGKRGRTKWTHLTAEDTTDYHTGWGHRKNEANYRAVGKMAGMRNSLARPTKKHKPE